jgi:GTP cyclohydrolase I
MVFIVQICTKLCHEYLSRDSLETIVEKLKSKKSLADVAEGRSYFQPLNWVGMEQIEAPILWSGYTLNAKVDSGVSLTHTSQRGIHMSRIYEILTKELFSKTWSPAKINEILKQILASQTNKANEAITDKASLKLYLTIPMRRKSLVSNLEGFRQYPLVLFFEKDASSASMSLALNTTITYSSTCPASAALSLQINESLASFSATPHAQRSNAQIKLQLKQIDSLDIEKYFSDLIDCFEKALGTPVQTLVKREDEQEFARLNAQNLMFCEDAARKLAAEAKSLSHVSEFQIKVSHLESLHPHNAVSFVSEKL